MYDPKPEHKFTSGLWTVGNRGADAFGQPVRPTLSPADIQTSLSITLPGPEARVVVDHRLQNRGSERVELASRAITQPKPGGAAVLTQTTGPIDKHALLPNGHLVFWPHTTGLDSRYITWGCSSSGR